MSRLTITLSEARYRALKNASAQRNKTIGQLIDESLDFYGIIVAPGSAKTGAPGADAQQSRRKTGPERSTTEVRAVRRKP